MKFILFIVYYITFSSLNLLSHSKSHKTASIMSDGKVNFTPVYATTSYLNQTQAKQLDEDLMMVPGFSIDQLMELAGLSCASSIYDAFPPTSFSEIPKILVVSGPGNNGGDGLVAARHLKHFGYDVEVLLPKRKISVLFKNIERQCQDMNINFLESIPTSESDWDSYDLIVDAIFGFSFKGVPRSPFDRILHQLARKDNVVSIDIPSGWDVEKGDTMSAMGFQPRMLISLTAPKLCCRFYKGDLHYVGGRFIPPFIKVKYKLDDFHYHGSDQFVKINCCYNTEDDGK